MSVNIDRECREEINEDIMNYYIKNVQLCKIQTETHEHQNSINTLIDLINGAYNAKHINRITESRQIEEIEREMNALGENICTYMDNNMRIVSIAIPEIRKKYMFNIAINRPIEHIQATLDALDMEVIELSEIPTFESQIKMTQLLEKSEIYNNILCTGYDAYVSHWYVFSENNRNSMFTIIESDPTKEQIVAENIVVNKDGSIDLNDVNNLPYVKIMKMTREELFFELCNLCKDFRAATLEKLMQDNTIIGEIIKKYFTKEWKANKELYDVLDREGGSPRWESTLLLSEKFSDVGLSCGADKTILKSHKLILAINSEYFEAILYGVDAIRNGRENIIDLGNFSVNSIKGILTFIYTRDINIEEIHDIREFIMAADYLQIKPIMRFVNEKILK